MRSAGSGSRGIDFESGGDESNDARIHHSELDSEFRSAGNAGFEQSRFSEPITAEYGEHNVR